MSSSKDSTQYTCTLSPDVLAKARTELNEDPDTRHIEVKQLKTRLEKVAGLQARTDTKFLLRFLRARKFDQERTFQLVTNYYEARKQQPDIFNDIKPSRVRHVFDDGYAEVLEHPNKDGCRVVVVRLSAWDPDRYPITELPKALFLLLSKLLEEEETQVNGIHIIANLDGFNLKQASQFTPGVAKIFLSILQDVLPLRLKQLDVANEPTFFDVVFAIAKPFMKEKLVKRFLLNGDKFDKLHTYISPDYLPSDLGGKLPLYSFKSWIDKLQASDAPFEEDNKFGFVNMKVSKSQKSTSKSGDADMQGLGGTFKKLDI